LTAEFLRIRGLPHAKSFLANDIIDAMEKATHIGYPLILKSRTGTSSRNVHLILNEYQLQECWPITPDPVLQQAIDIPSEQLKSEYTCSVFKTACGKLLGPFHARRTVRGGTSWNIEVKHFEQLDDLMLSIGKAVQFEGSLNVQLMIGENGPVPFEINARFSGTTAVRAHFGFNEPDMAVRSYLFGEELQQPKIRNGIALRYHEEVFVDGADSDTLQHYFAKGVVRHWY
jgi:carbamoyl-phosphate synthase large subunit